jgi:hypothetical protein
MALMATSKARAAMALTKNLAAAVPAANPKASSQDREAAALMKNSAVSAVLTEMLKATELDRK